MLECTCRCLYVIATCIFFATAVEPEKNKKLDISLNKRETEPQISADDAVEKKSRLDLSYDAQTETNLSDELDPSIEYVPKYASKIEFGQISGISIDPHGNIGVFHRGQRKWDATTFDRNNKYDMNRGPIRDSTIMLLDKNGNKIFEWGENMFYLPHGLTIDFEGNYWLTDVAMHQVFKFDSKSIEEYKQHLNKQKHRQTMCVPETEDVKNLFANSILKPSIILGKAFEPGDDHLRFCKPTAIAVQKNGDFFVSDGYCNSRIIKFNNKGRRIMQWGRAWSFDAVSQNPPPYAYLIPHALALAEEHDYIFIADRENGRVVCNFASNGTFHKEYKSPLFNDAVYSIAYAYNKLYVVNGNRYYSDDSHVRGIVVDINTGKVLSQFAPYQIMHQIKYPVDMDNPHDIAVSPDGKEIYVIELDSHKIYKFNRGFSNYKQR